MAEDERRSGGAWIAVVAVAALAAALGVAWWQLKTRAPEIDAAGFDVAVAPEKPAAPAAASAPKAAAPDGGSVEMVKPGAELQAKPAARPGPAAAPVAAAPSPAGPAPLTFTEAARRYEGTVRDFGRRMERQYPSLTQYARDWNSHPDLRALRDQYWRDRDPIRFAYGLAQSESFPALVKKYAADPGVRAFITEGVKTAPAELLTSSAQLFQSDPTVRRLVGYVTKEVGVPDDAKQVLGPDGKARPAAPSAR